MVASLLSEALLACDLRGASSELCALASVPLRGWHAPSTLALPRLVPCWGSFPLPPGASGPWAPEAEPVSSSLAAQQAREEPASALTTAPALGCSHGGLRSRWVLAGPQPAPGLGATHLPALHRFSGPGSEQWLLGCRLLWWRLEFTSRDIRWAGLEAGPQVWPQWAAGVAQAKQSWAVHVCTALCVAPGISCHPLQRG